MHITELSARRPVTVTMFYVGAILLGLYSFSRLGVDFLPDIRVPRLVVRAEYPGADIQTMEQRVTEPLESAVRGLREVAKIRSITRSGICFVYAEFAWGADMDLAFIHTRSAIDRIQGMLPAECARPSILRFDPASSPVMTLTVSGRRAQHPASAADQQRALMELKEVSKAVVKQRLEQIDGIARVAVSGGLEREISVELDEKKCRALGIGFGDVHSALARSNVAVSGGMVFDGANQYPLRIEAGLRTPQDIADLPVKTTENGTVVTIGRIAAVTDGVKERSGLTRLNGNEVITLFVFKESGANTVNVTRRAYRTLHDLRDEFADIDIRPVFDQAEFIQGSISDVVSALALGALLAFVVLFFFLRDMRSSLLIGVSIPLSLILTVTCMYMLGIQFNIISLAGLTLGIGMLVDNSIVVVENIYRHRSEGRGLFEAAVLGGREVTPAVAASTFTTVAAFLPLIYVKGLAGQLFHDQSLTVTISLSASLLVALTVTVMLASRPGWSWGNGRARAVAGDAGRRLLGAAARPLLDGFQAGYDKVNHWYMALLEICLQHRGATVLAGLGVFVAGLLLALSLGRELFPVVDYKEFVVAVEYPPEMSLAAVAERVADAERRLRADPRIATVLASVGVTENVLDESYQPAENKAVIEIAVKPGERTFEVMRDVRAWAARATDFTTEIRARTSPFEQLFPSSERGFRIRIRGPDLDTLASVSTTVATTLASDARLGRAEVSLKRGGGVIVLNVKQDELARHGIMPEQIADFLSNHLRGAAPTAIEDFADRIGIRLSYGANDRELKSILDLQYSWVRIGQDGKREDMSIPLSRLATVGERAGFEEVVRENQSRTAYVTTFPRGVSFERARRIAAELLQRTALPRGYTLDIGAGREEVFGNYRNIFAILLIAVALVYFILSCQYESVRVPLVVLSSIPLSCAGVSAALFFTGNTLNIMSLTGLIALAGTVVNDAIIEIDFVHRQCSAGMDVASSIRRARAIRFRPIMMNTVTSVLGLLPMALSFGQGAELRRPLAWTIIGGLSASMLFGCTVAPIIYSFLVRTPCASSTGSSTTR